MSYAPGMASLGGLSLRVAELYGKPHVGAFYAGSGAKTNRVEEGARCAVCRSMATNSHHVAPLSKGRFFRMSTPCGSWDLKTALFALCGSGTTGCHNGFHGGAMFRAEWSWDTDAAAEAWWSGELLAEYGPHSELLYEYGRWSISDLSHGTVFEIRGLRC